MPRLRPFKRFFQSVFTKLLFISLVTWFLILTSVIITFVISKHSPNDPFYKNASLYIQYIIKDLGSPPDQNTALRLSNATGIHISFSGKTQRWSTQKSFPMIENVRFHRLNNNSKLQIGRKIGGHFLKMPTADGFFFFEFVGDNDEDTYHKFAHLLLMLLLSGVLLIFYFSIKYVLHPLKWLSKGVNEVHSGNLNHQVPTRGSDELTELASSFNQMTLRLKQMLRTKEYLLRDISHELRSPLTRIKVALEFLDKKDLKTDIEQDISEMEQMINKILQSAKEHHGSIVQTFSRCNLNNLAEETCKKFKNTAPGVEYVSTASKAVCLADASSLQTVISNCIENGLKFSPKDGKALQVHLAVKKDDATITITDFGCGIEESELPYIFEPFYRIDSSRSRKTGGFGLGLSICKSIIDSHGGRINATSKIGHGTQVKITLPLCG